MSEKKYDIFLSYRRDGGFATAKHLYDLLTQDGYTVSFDVDNLREGDFDTTLLERIDACTDFLLVVDDHTFDRTIDPDFDPNKDWMRKELAQALQGNKNVVPILLTGARAFPAHLPDDVAGVITKNGPEYNKYYFDEFYKRLKVFLHSQPVEISPVERRHRWLLATICSLVVLLLASRFYLLYDKVLSRDKDTTVMVTDSICINPVLGEFLYTGPVDADGRPHGKGFAKFTQGDTYEGGFVHGTFEGECTYLNDAEGDRFMGTYKDNAREQGTYVWQDGTYFTGTFKNNDVCKGKIYDVNGNLLQEFTGNEKH